MNRIRVLILVAVGLGFVPQYIHADDVPRPNGPATGGQNTCVSMPASVSTIFATTPGSPAIAETLSALSSPEDATGPAPVWASVDFFVGWVRGVHAPPLLTAKPSPGGASLVLFGNDNLDGESRTGFQFRGGFWLDSCATCGIEAGGLFLNGVTDRGRAGGAPGAIIGRPFFNALTSAPDFEIVSVPGAVTGGAAIDAAAHALCGADIAFRHALCCDCRGRLDWLLGYRFLSFDDAVGAFEDIRPTTAPFTPGTRFGVADGFTATNRFHGLLVGLTGEYQFNSWYVQGRGAISLGDTSRRVTIAGATSIQSPPLPPVLSPGGLLALSSNSGTVSESERTLVPELSARLGYQISSNMRIYVGYSFLLWPGVFRAANQIDPVVNPALLPPVQAPVAGPLRPLFPDRQNSHWVQGISIGLESRF
jgi:hypothetical protein